MPTLLLLTLVMLQPAASSAQPRTGPRESAITWSEPPPELSRSLPGDVRFGYLSVPEDHANPMGNRLRIAFLILPARSSTPAQDPVVFIPGGPGLAGIKTFAAAFAGSAQYDLYRERRDLILIDPRGHGYSDPPRCSNLSGAEPPPGASPDAERRWLAKLADCRRRLVEQGVRLEALSSVQVAHDLEALRSALGAPQLNLYGASYGTRIAAEAMRQVPAAIRAVHFSGPVPAGRYRGGYETEVAEEVISTLMRRCAEQEACRTAYPRLRDDFDAILARVRREPVHVPVPRSADAAADELVFDETLLRVGLSQMLLNRTLAAAAPLIIHTLAQQGHAARGLASQLNRAIGGAEEGAPGTALAFWCNDGVVTRTSAEHLQTRCRTWLGDAYDGHDAEPLRSDIPAVITAGELDPRTPPSYAQFLANGLSRAQVAIVPSHGHERPPDCSYRISRDLYEAPDQAPDTSCLASVPPIAFVTGVVPSALVSGAVLRTVRRPWLAALPGAASLLLVASAVGMAIQRIRTSRRGRQAGGAIAAGAWLAVTVVGLVFVLGIAAALIVGMRRHFLIPLIGLPDAWAWLLAVPWVLLVVTALAALLSISRTFGSTTEPPAWLRWITLLGAALLLAFWFSSALV